MIASVPAPALDARALIADSRFTNALGCLAARGMDRAAFARLPMPQGLAPEDAWGLCRSIRRAQGISYRDSWTVGGLPTTQWFYPTHSIEVKLRELTRRTAAGSQLGCALSERLGRRFITDSLIGEVVAAASCEGFDIAYEEARRVCLGDAVPRRPVERLVANMHDLLVAMLDGDLVAVDAGAIHRMYGKLTRDVPVQDFGDALVWGDEWPGDPMDPCEVIEEVCAMMAGELVDPAEHPIVTSQRIICHFWRNRVFPSCNYVLGSLVCRLYLKNRGFAAFTYLPISQMSLAWRRGECADPGVWPYRECCDVEGTDYDWTLYWESCLELLLREARTLEETILRLKDEDDRILLSLGDDHSFNHRQRGLLQKAVLAPAIAVRIEEYRAQHELAYSTARKDLMGLVERGLLEMHYEGKAQVFTARDDLKRRLARRYEV